MDRNAEQVRVNQCIQEIILQEATLLRQMKKVGEDAYDIKENFWSDVTVNADEADDLAETYSSIKQQAQLLLERERNHHQMDVQLKTLERLKFSPYFGRVDFHEDGETESETLYIGIRSLMDQSEQNFLIYDWRAPISSLYYDYIPGTASYKTPEGTIEGKMTLKRQFIIRHGLIQGMFDTGITIGDEILQEVLGNQASQQMKSIVATIQREQNRIIRNDTSKLLVVQGVAGSGKTSAALQRIAFLLYRHRGTISSQNIMLFSPNPLFNSYVSTVLPELGEENMQQSTFLEFLTSRVGKKLALEDSFMQLESLYDPENAHSYELRMKSIKWKSSLKYKEVIDFYLEKVNQVGLCFHPITLKKRVLITSEEILSKFLSIEKSASTPAKLEIVQSWLLKEVRRLKRKELNKDWVKDSIQYLDKEDYLDSFKKLERKSSGGFEDFQLEEKFLANMVVARAFKPVIRQVKRLHFVDYKTMYRSLFLQLPSEWDEMVGISLQHLDEQKLMYEDATPFAYLKEKIEGHKSNMSIRHVFIDEAQDYSPFQFAFIRELFPNSKLTLLGDINQGIYAHTTNESAIQLGISEEDQEIITLTKSYRSTKPIVEFTRSLLPDGDQIEPFNRDGRLPTLTVSQKREDHWQSLLATLDEITASNYETIAVICKTAKESAAVYQKLKQHRSVHLVEKGTITFEKGITVIPAYLAKGIEFDAVVIYDASDQTYFRESERRLFYTACTRAMHELHVLVCGKISPLLAGSMDYVKAAHH